MQNHVAETRKALEKDVEQLRENATQVVQDVRKHATAHVEKARQLVSDTASSVQQKAAERPFALLGIGFLFGLVIGARFRR